MVHRSNILVMSEQDSAVDRPYRAELQARGYAIDAATVDDSPGSRSPDRPIDVIVLELLTRGAAAATRRLIDHARSLSGANDHRSVPVLALCDAESAASMPVGDGVDEIIYPPLSGAHIAGRIAALVRLNTMQHELIRRHQTYAQYGLDAPDVLPPAPDEAATVLIVGNGARLALVTRAMAPTTSIVGALTRDNAETYLAQQQFDQIILDMPHIEAQDFLIHLRRNPRHYSLPVLVLLDGADASAALFEAGATDVLIDPIETADLASKSSGYMIEHRFREKLRAVYRDARHTATGDSLTGLFSRGFMLQHLERLLKDRSSFGDPVTVAAVSIANLGEINREHGYAVGDRIIRQIGVVLGQLLRGEDMTARWKGGQFVVVLISTGQEDAAAAIGRLSGVINSTRFSVENHTAPVEVRIDTALVAAEPADRPESLVARALALTRT